MLATDPALENATGGYYRSMKLRERPLQRPDRELAEGLWAESVRLSGVDLPT